MNLFNCNHDTATSACLAGDTIASVWECDECGYPRPFTAEDYAFCNAWAWSAQPAFPFAR